MVYVYDSWTYEIVCAHRYKMGLRGGSVGKESTCDAGDWGSISGSGKSSGVGNGNQLQYSCLRNSMERGAW